MGKPSRWADFSVPTLIGVVNATPDSFSDGGKFLEPENALREAERHAQSGASIVEFGAESTRPGSHPVDAEEEWRRLQPIFDSLTSPTVVSVDTYKSSVAERALQRGAAIINDVSALRADRDLVRVVADHRALLIMMHSKDGPLPHATRTPKDYSDVVKEISETLLRQVEFALANGVNSEALALDPGMGLFVSPDPKYSWQLINELPRFCELVRPFPVLLGVSRKGFIGGDVRYRDALSQFVALCALERGVQLVRTHDVTLLREFMRVRDTLSAGRFS